MATGLHATVDLEIRDAAIALASIPDPSMANYSNVLMERERQEERIMADQEAAAQRLEEEARQATGAVTVKPEPMETIVLDDTPSPAPVRTATPATPSTLPNWLKRKAPIAKTEAPDAEITPKKAGKKTAPMDRVPVATEGPAKGTGAGLATMAEPSVVTATGPEAKAETDPDVPAGLIEATARGERPEEDLEIEEVEPPATEPGTMVFPKVRRDSHSKRCRANRLCRRPALSVRRREKTARGSAAPDRVDACGVGRRRSNVRS